MEQFSLEKYLENPTRKVVTRNGKTVRIVCWDKLGEYPIIGCVKYSDDYEDLESYDINGFKYSFDREDQNDLFFADEEKELTEFEKAVKQVMWTAYNYDDCSNGKDVDDISNVKATSKTLLDLARKEIEKDIEEGATEFAKSYMEDVNPSFEKVKESEELWKWKMSCLRGINKAYEQGKQDAMQDFLEKAELFFNYELYVSLSDQICSMNEFKTMKDFVNYFKNYIEKEA